MKTCLVSGYSVNSVWQDKLTKISGNELVMFGFNGLGLVSYKKELSGETEYFHDVAKLSAQLSCVVISGCDTDTYGVFKHSAVIAEKGKILGVSDMVHSIDDSEFVSGGNYRVYQTGAGKIGIIIAEDLFFPESARVLALCDADLICCIFKKMDTVMPQIMLRAGAFANGVAMSLVSSGYSSVSDIRGNIICASQADIVNVNVKSEKDFHLIGSRRRGIYRDFNSGY
ncbi:MAG: hypothetical protein IKZ38_02825 [Clostridia bacterium]|nr:hypothetical protein [Clostridia bacterium]